MEKYDILIIGGGPAGVTCALSAKSTNPDKRIGLIRKESQAMIPCGIPYVFYTLNNIGQNILSDEPLLASNVDIIIDEVIGGRDRTLMLANNGSVEFQKLIIAAGSNAIIPNIPGVWKENVFLIRKDMEYLNYLKDKIFEAEKIVILGGGYIGVEVGDELVKAQKNVTIVEMKDELLSTMDKEFGKEAQKIIEENGGKVITGKSITNILGGDKVKSVELNDGTQIDCDLLIISCGYKPNTEMANKFELEFDENNGILVDSYLRTSKKDIFAIGDCAAKYDYFSSEYSHTLLASTAMAEGRLVGSNLYSIRIIRQYPGVLGTFSTKVGNRAFAVCGMTEKRAISRCLDYRIGIARAINRHPGKLPGASEMTIKLIFSAYSHTLMGAEITGGDSIGEMINIISVMILNKMTAIDINNLQIGTHPLLTASPIAYPLINATTDAIKNLYNHQHA